LKKQLAEKEENFKLRTWNAVHSLTESSEYTGTSLRTLERFTWPNNGWVSYPEKNGIEIGRVVFNDGLLKVSVRKHKIMKKFYFYLPRKRRIRNKDRRVKGWSGNGSKKKLKRHWMQLWGEENAKCLKQC